MDSLTKYTVLATINEVRRLLGLNTITQLDDDKDGLIMLRMLNMTVAEIGDYGDWHEMYNEVSVTCFPTAIFSIGINHPLQRIYEISFSGQRQALYPTTIEHINQLQRGHTFGETVRFFALKGTDNVGNPMFSVHPVPTTAASGNLFNVVYFRKESLYDITSADQMIPFPADVVVAGLYYRALIEESGGQWSPESIQAQKDFHNAMDEALRRYNADTGTDIYFSPARYGRGG